MLTLDFKSVLISLLLIALIVLVVFLIVLVARLLGALKMANTILDSGVGAIDKTKQKMDAAAAKAEEKKAKVRDMVSTGTNLTKNIVLKKIGK